MELTRLWYGGIKCFMAVPAPLPIAPSKPNYKVNKHEARLYLLQGMGVGEVARKVGVSSSAISQMFNGELEDIKRYLAFRADPSTVYEYTESQIISNLTPDTIKKMSGYQSVGSASLLRQTVRLERGLSTGKVVLEHELKLDRSKYMALASAEVIDV